jgi:hypothetical protein
MRKSIFYVCLLAAFATAVFSCKKDQNLPNGNTVNNTPVNEQQVRQDIQKALQQIQTVQGVDMSVQTRMLAQFIVVPAGSNNALAQALTDAGAGGIVYLRSGTHTETAGVIVRSKVTIIGENGAVLKVKSVASLMDLSNGVTTINAGIHVLNAPQTNIQNLEIQPLEGDGSVAILYENSPLSAAMSCTIKHFMFGVTVEKSNQMTIIGNKMTGTTSWKTHPGLQAGIFIVNGKSPWIANNEAESFVAGIFTGDQYGSLMDNNMHNNVQGITLCHFVGLKMPDGRLTNAEFNSSDWKLYGNKSNNNVTGYLVIDGSFNNTLEGNTATGNSLYDIELAGQTSRVGFPMSPCHDNRVVVTANQLVKDCGINNNVTGGIRSLDACTDPVTNNMVMAWNLASTQAIANMGSGPDALPPMPESRVYAMVQIAVHDALNNITPRYHTYALNNAQDRFAHPDAAVAQAAHDVIVNQLPPQQIFADNLLATSLNAIANGDAKTRGIALGKAAAAAIINLRANDGVANAQIPYVQGTLPGQYRSTPPFDGPPFNGFVGVPAWGKIKPFGMTSGSQFRAPAPYPINSADYTADFNDVKTLGKATGSTRTADQSQIAIFWLENIPLSFNRIARTMATQKNLGAWETARLFALLQIAEADANIGCFESKFYYNYWRPITAVRLGDTDGNPNTVGDATWDVLAPPTPPVPDYPSNHAANGGVGAAVLAAFFGNDNITFTQTSSSMPNTTRTLSSFSQASREIALSRVYVGYHFRNACMKGEEQGKQIGQYIFDHYLGVN